MPRPRRDQQTPVSEREGRKISFRKTTLERLSDAADREGTVMSYLVDRICADYLDAQDRRRRKADMAA